LKLASKYQELEPDERRFHHEESDEVGSEAEELESVKLETRN